MSPDVNSQRAETPSALPPGTRLGEFELLSLLGVGGFGIVYLAFDHALEREVAVKEYMPASLAGRTETMFVSVRSHSDAETFALGLKSFVNEARLLARFDHPSLLKVLRFWEANGTAYMAMPVMRGRTVKELRLSMRGAPEESWLRELLDPLLGAIERLHGEGVYHRDIAPDNIQIEPDGHPVLLDFGAARRVIGDKSQALTAILKPAYAPIEQYGEAGSVKQGPWTDIYALGATVHYLLLGRPPPPATARAVHDDASALTVDHLPGFTANFLHIVDWMLAPRPLDRPQNVAALRDALAGRSLPPQRRDLAPPPSQWEPTRVLARPGVGIPLDFGADATMRMPRAAAAVPDPATTQVQVRADGPTFEHSIAGPAASSTFEAPLTPPRRNSLLPVLLGVGATAAVVAAVWVWPRAPAPPLAAALPASAPVIAEAASSPAPAPVASQAESAITTVNLQPTPAAPAAPAAVATSRVTSHGASAPAPAPDQARPAPADRPKPSRPAVARAPAPAATVTAAPPPAAAAQVPPKPAPEVSGPRIVTAPPLLSGFPAPASAPGNR